jgi:hypothetical protein
MLTTPATERLFARLEKDHRAYAEAVRPYHTIGALKGFLAILAERFPEVEAYITEMEDWQAGQDV